MYKVVSTEHHFYPHVVLELQDTTTNKTKWWCYADFHDEELCRVLGVKTLPVVPLSNSRVTEPGYPRMI